MNEPATLRFDRVVVQISGTEVVEYLQGQLSQNVEGMQPGEARWSLALEPQGKVVSFFRLVRTEHGFLADTDAGHEDALVERLERFRLRTDITIERRGDLGVLGVRSGEAPGSTDTQVVVGFDWYGWAGFDVIGPLDDEPGDDAEAQRIRAGFPRMGSEITDDRIPAEVTGLVGMTVDFDKGCYVGQELVARIDSRGASAPRRLVQFVSASPTVAGSAVRVGADEVGWVTSATSDDDGPTAMGYVNRSVDDGATVQADGVELTVVPLSD